MQLNNKLFRGYRGFHRILTAILFMLFGLVASGIGVAMFFLKDENGEKIKPLYCYITIGVGALVVIFGIILLVFAIKSIKRHKPLSEEEVKKNIASDQPGLEINDQKLFFHFTGKLNQSYVVENKDGVAVFDCKLKKFNPFGSNTYEFKNLKTGSAKTYKIGKVLNTSSSGLFEGEIMESSGFKIDGVNCWEYLRNRGYEIKHKLSVKTVSDFDIYQLGKKIATVVPTSKKDPWNEGSRNPLTVGHGIYRLEINTAKLEDIVMMAFIIARVDIIE